MRHLTNDTRGASAVEYIITLGLIALVSVAAFAMFGQDLNKLAEREGECVRTFQCGAGAPSSFAGSGSAGDKGAETPATARSEGVLAAVGGFFRDAVEGAVYGDFVDEPSGGHITGQILVGLTPAGVIGDVRDIGAGARDVWEGRPGGWANLGLATVGLVPIAGDGIKAIARTGKAVDSAAKISAGEKLAAAGARGGECSGGICTGGSCFGAGTPVMTPSGEQPIETIEEGQLVVARDPETGIVSERHVIQRFVTNDREVLDLGLEKAGITEHLTVTPEHPFWRAQIGWIGAGGLEIGDVVATASGEARVVSMQSLRDRITVYNFEVELVHTYFVGSLGAWVHNACGADSFTGMKGAEVKLGPNAQERVGAGGGHAADGTKGALPKGPHGLPETAGVLQKGENVDLKTYGRVADPINDHVRVVQKNANLTEIEQRVEALRAGQAIPKVKMAPAEKGYPPIITEGYESYVAGQMAGKPVVVELVSAPNLTPGGLPFRAPGALNVDW
jgi:Flp pilus assembly pilin Flp